MSLLLLLLLLAASTPPSWGYYYFGASLTASLKNRTYNTHEVELRNQQATFYCIRFDYACLLGNCGVQIQSTTRRIAWDSYRLTWCQQEITTRIRLPSNRPFQIRYPSYTRFYYNWVNNIRGSNVPFRMMAHVDLGTRSDTWRANRLPVANTLPIIRVTRNCKRTFNLNVFDPDGDRVRCRVPTNRNTYECNLCGPTRDLTVDEDRCKVTYGGNGQYGFRPVELVLEDFPGKKIKVFYSDGSHAVKEPFARWRHRREAFMTSTPDPRTTMDSTATPATTAAAASAAATTAGATNVAATNAGATNAAATNAAATNAGATNAAATNAAATTAVAPTSTRLTNQGQRSSAPVIIADFTTTTDTTAVARSVTTAASQTTAGTQRVIQRRTTTTRPVTTASRTNGVVTTDPYRHSVRSLSRLPLQFTILVDRHSAPSCIDGDYFPVFFPPTPANGAIIPAFVNRTLEITVNTSAQFSRIHRLLLTGPSGIYQQRTRTGSYVIKWTPSAAELDHYFVICFLSEGLYHWQVYHSELRCVTVNVGHHDAVVTCSETMMKVEVEKDDLIRRHENELHLKKFSNASSCNLKKLSNQTHLVAVMSLSDCGTFVEEDDKNIFFRNQITSANPDYVISRHNDVEISFCCVYPRKTNLTVGFRHKNPYAFKERGFGSFTFQFEFFVSPRFRQQVDGSKYPVEVYLKQMIYMQIQSTSSIPNTQLFVESCRATPYDDPNSRISYTIIENGCVKDKTVQLYNGSNSQFRFGMEAFEFIGAHEEVYITCSVLLCESDAHYTRCSQGCVHSRNWRHKREVAGQTSSHFISQGPLRLVKAPDSPVSAPGLNLVLNVVFVVGCLLACAVVIYRSRRSRAKYQPLPTDESD